MISLETFSDKRKKTEIQNEASEREKTFQEKLDSYKNVLNNQMQRNCKKFIVHLSSQFEVNGSKAGSKLISWVDRNFHTLEERRHE